jgi:putative (di)nucleoside polyphosphate hydrolase
MSTVPHPGYRPCAGVALINAAGHVFIGRRRKQRNVTLVNEWQMPQGGVDEGEQPLTAALRELYEETNVRSASLVAEAPEWVAYDLPEGARSRFGGRYVGQTQKWFLFRFEGEAAEIDVHHPAGGAHSPEFTQWRWERWEALPDLVVPFKREVYVRVAEWFAPLSTRK